MKKPFLALVAGVVVGVGFAIAHSMADGQTIYTGATVVPGAAPLAAPQNGRIQWEYQVMQAAGGDLPVEQLNHMGNDGWEMCGVRQRGQGVSFFYFKREKIGHVQGGLVAQPPTYQSVPSTSSFVGPPETYRAAVPTPAIGDDQTKSVLKSDVKK